MIIEHAPRPLRGVTNLHYVGDSVDGLGDSGSGSMKLLSLFGLGAILFLWWSGDL